jgi:hypothetical protein
MPFFGGDEFAPYVVFESRQVICSLGVINRNAASQASVLVA